MTGNREPFVSVVTPVYNGAKFLPECIESVLAQSYTNWEYIVVNNKSTDDTLAIAEDYARRDARVRVHDNADFLPLLPNWNHAMRQIAPKSVYCKVVHADDWLFPECLERMVEVAEAHPNVGLVGAYSLRGNKVALDGLPYPSTTVSGREVGRAFMLHIAKLGGLWMFGSPTASLLRADLVRRRPRFYNENNFNADAEAACEVLRESDLGFVHQVLSYTREHEERQSMFHSRYRSNIVYDLVTLTRQGPFFLSDVEFRRCLDGGLRQYYRNLAQGMFAANRSELWRFHREELRKLEQPFSTLRFARAVGTELGELVFNPERTLRRVHRWFGRTSRPASGAQVSG